MKQFFNGSLLGTLVLSVVGCGSQPLSAKDGRVHTPGVVAVSGQTAPQKFCLGAGDGLGQQVFTRAVALARAENPDGWRLALADGSQRAIYPAFTGLNDYSTLNPDFETRWAYLSLLRIERPVAPQRTSTSPEAPAIIRLGVVPLPE